MCETINSRAEIPAARQGADSVSKAENSQKVIGKPRVSTLQKVLFRPPSMILYYTLLKILEALDKSLQNFSTQKLQDTDAELFSDDRPEFSTLFFRIGSLNVVLHDTAVNSVREAKLDPKQFNIKANRLGKLADGGCVGFPKFRGPVRVPAWLSCRHQPVVSCFA
jgi:hypothetical protein